MENNHKGFQLPKNFEEYVDEKAKVDKSIEGQKSRLEQQLRDRQTYVQLLELKLKCLDEYIKTPSDQNKLSYDIAKGKVDRFNLEIEVVAQKNIFVDTYIYYKEDFLKRYKNQGGKKESVFKTK